MYIASEKALRSENLLLCAFRYEFIGKLDMTLKLNFPYLFRMKTFFCITLKYSKLLTVAPVAPVAVAGGRSMAEMPTIKAKARAMMSLDIYYPF